LVFKATNQRMSSQLAYNFLSKIVTEDET